MRTLKKLLAGLLFLLCVQTAASGQEKAKRIDEFIRPFIEANQFSGVVLASENGKVVYEKAFGLANADYKIPNARDTRIGIASITKMMTAVIRTRLVEEKKISMDDKLSKYIPDFPNGDKITIEMLASHRSGIPHRVMPPEQEAVPHPSYEMIEQIKKAKLLFEPGTKETYSSAGYTVLARVMEIASGKTYSQLLQEYVFAPAGMRDSLDFDSEAIMERRAQDYFIGPDGMSNATLKDYSFLVGAGSVFGTASDLERFAEAIVTGKYGEAVKTRWVNNDLIAGSGSTNGHRSYFEIQKDNRYSFVILSNLRSGAFDQIQQGLQAIMTGKDIVAPVVIQPKIIANPNKDLNEFLGKYRTPDGRQADIVLINGYLYSGDIKFFPTAPDCFFEYRFFGNVCFVRDAERKIKEIEWKGTGFNLKWTRL